MTIEKTLHAIEQAGTAGAAMDEVPESWGFFLTGPDHAGEHACAMLPDGIDGPARRIYEGGLAMGRGPTRLEAMRSTVSWMRSRVPAEVRNAERD